MDTHTLFWSCGLTPVLLVCSGSPNAFSSLGLLGQDGPFPHSCAASAAAFAAPVWWQDCGPRVDILWVSLLAVLLAVWCPRPLRLGLLSVHALCLLPGAAGVQVAALGKTPLPAMAVYHRHVGSSDMPLTPSAAGHVSFTTGAARLNGPWTYAVPPCDRPCSAVPFTIGSGAGRDSYCSDCPAFFLAATLVETLCEHFASSASVSPVPLSLDVLVPATSQVAVAAHTSLKPAASAPLSPAGAEVFALDDLQCRLPCGQSELAALFSSVSFRALRDVPSGLHRPERFADWAADGVPGSSPVPQGVLVLTSDGSFSKTSGTAGWGVVLSCVSPDSLLLPGRFVGCFAEDMRSFLAHLPPGSRLLDPFFAEVAGLLWAAIAAASLPWHGEVLFRADNISALDGARGVSNFPPHPLCALARHFHCALQVGQHCRPLYQHVPGHAGDAANELADALAALGAAGQASASPFHLDFSFWSRDDCAPAAWLPHLCLLETRPAEFPPLRLDLHSWPRFAAPVSIPCEDVMRPFTRDASRLAEASPCPAPVTLTLALVTYNALSLVGEASVRPALDGLHGATGRVALLSALLACKGVHVAGLQECRTPAGTMTCGPYTRFSSGADDKAGFGVELWVHSSSPVRAESVVVLHATPTLLVAGATLAGSPIRILVGHAPHKAHTEAELLAWWQRTSEVCRSLSGAAPWVLLMDANCRVGSEVSSAVGPWHGDEQDTGGGCFHELLRFLSSWLPATFEACMQGDGHTLYLRRNGSLARSDYVAVPAAWGPGSCQAWTDVEITAGHSCMDHFAAVLAVDLLLSHPGTLRRATRISAAAIADPCNAEVIRAIFHRAPRPPWHIDASEHAATVVEHLYAELSRLFPAAKRRFRAHYFSEETAALHQGVSTLRHRVRSGKLALHWALIRCAFGAWRSPALDFDAFYCGRWLWQLRCTFGFPLPFVAPVRPMS